MLWPKPKPSSVAALASFCSGCACRLRARLVRSQSAELGLQGTVELSRGDEETLRTFIMPELLLSQDDNLRNASLWVLLSFNGQDFYNTSRVITISSGAHQAHIRQAPAIVVDVPTCHRNPFI